MPLDYFLIVILADAHKGPNPQDEEDSWRIHEDSDIWHIILTNMRMITDPCVARYRSCRCIDWWRQYLGHSRASRWEGPKFWGFVETWILSCFGQISSYLHWISIGCQSQDQPYNRAWAWTFWEASATWRFAEKITDWFAKGKSGQVFIGKLLKISRKNWTTITCHVQQNPWRVAAGTGLG